MNEASGRRDPSRTAVPGRVQENETPGLKAVVDRVGTQATMKRKPSAVAVLQRKTDDFYWGGAGRGGWGKDKGDGVCWGIPVSPLKIKWVTLLTVSR